jgi:polyferredoxin
MKAFRKILGFFILGNIIPLLIWSWWSESYELREGIDTLFNSLHPYIVGWIVNFVLIGILVIIAVGLYLIDPDSFEEQVDENKN